MAEPTALADDYEGIPAIWQAISHAATSAENSAGLLTAIFQALKNQFALAHLTLALYNQDKGAFDFTSVTGTAPLGGDEFAPSAAEQALCSHVIASSQPVVTDNGKPASDLWPAATSDCRSLAGLPLIRGEKILGALVLCSHKSHAAYFREHLDILTFAAEMVAMVSHGQQLHTALQQSREINQVLREITSAIHGSPSLDDLFAKIHGALSRVIDVTNFYIGLYEKATNRIRFPFFRDEYDDLSVWDVSYLRTDSLTFEVFEKLRPIFLKKADLELLEKQQRLVGTTPKIWMGIPLMTKTEPIGVMVLQSYSNPELYDEQDLELLSAVSEQVAVAVERKRAEEDMAKSEAKYRHLFTTMPNGFYTSTPEGYIVEANPAFMRMLGYDNLTELQQVHVPTEMYVDADDREALVRQPQNTEFSEGLETYRLKKKDGQIVWIEDNARYIKDDTGAICFHQGICRDITRRKQAEHALQVSEEKHRLLYENAVEGIFQTTPDGRFLSVNPSFLRIMGFHTQEELCQDITDIGKQQYVNPDDRVIFRRLIESQGVVKDFETELYKNGGEKIWVSLNARAVRDENGGFFYEGFLQDISERKRAQEELYRVSIRDHLTGICNRRYIFERLTVMFEERQRDVRDFSLAIVDLDFFKKINDTHGHQAGDFILQEFAAILVERFRPYDLVGRYGGEEFIVITMNTDIVQTKNMFERIRKYVATRVFDFQGIPIRLTFSAGIANTGPNYQDMTVEDLIRKADERLYLAKEQGRDRIVDDA